MWQVWQKIKKWNESQKGNHYINIFTLGFDYSRSYLKKNNTDLNIKRVIREKDYQIALFKTTFKFELSKYRITEKKAYFQ